MAKYFYIARDRVGNKITGSEDASGPDEVINRLQVRDLLVVSVLPELKQGDLPAQSTLGSGVQARPRIKHHRVTSDDLVLFCRQLATLLGAGVTILKSLEIIAQQVPSQRLYQVIRDLQGKMEAGLSFHEAMSKHPKVFTDLWVNLVESGEASGNLAMVLNRLAGYLEQNAAFKRKIISATIYPSILFVAGTGALLFMTIKIIPTFVELFKGFNITLPALTQVLVAVSVFIRKFALIMLGIIVVGVFLLRKYVQTNEGRRQMETVLFHLPIFGEFYRVVVIERFTSEMSTLVESGVPILYSLEIAEHSVGNLTLGNIIRKVKDDVREGKPLSQPLQQSGFFDPMAVQMVSIGEEIGELSNMFKRLNVFYQEYVETFLTRFTTMFEPLMLVFMGLVVGIMVIGMFLPIFQITQIK
ncbi:MAG: type II secretion system F family protein [Candidatus Omnitrophica bacterium]|nr:type II secretion system F family protein [Candidatus Omnitrophota bacterium]